MRGMDRLSESSGVLEPSPGVLQFKLPRTVSSIYGVDVVQNNFKKNKHVQILSDNIMVVAFVNEFGGASTELDCLARDIHLMAIENKIT